MAPVQFVSHPSRVRLAPEDEAELSLPPRQSAPQSWCAVPRQQIAEREGAVAALSADIQRIIDSGRATHPFGALKIAVLETRREALQAGRPFSEAARAIDGRIDALLAIGRGASAEQLAELKALHAQLRAELGLVAREEPARELFRTASYADAERLWKQYNRENPGLRERLDARGPSAGVDPALTRPVDASRFRPDLTLREYQELRRDLLLQMRLHPERANEIYRLAEAHQHAVPPAYRHDFRVFLGKERVSGMVQGALEWQRQLCTRQSSGDPDHPSLYDARGLTDYAAYEWWGGDKSKMLMHLWGRGVKVDHDRALTNAYRIPPELLVDYLAEVDAAAGLR